ncbi:MAG TPA: pyruvate, phosphate dikinase [bacterium]|nr:pyruvate, phosphate dikinase [bacterium]
MSNKYVYTFGAGKAEGNSKMKDLLGGKGANLAEMSGLGIPVPAGFTISTEVCTHYYAHDRNYPKDLADQVDAGLRFIEKTMEAKFGDPANPLLLSVRSGARASMPGMMNTVLNLGLTAKTIEGLIAKTKNERFAYDSYRRLIQMYGEVVMEAKGEDFEHAIDELKRSRNVKLDTELTAADLKELCRTFKEIVKRDTGRDFPEDVREQLWGGIGAVFGSWNTERAIAYRRMNQIPEHWGTAVNLQAMVFGNMGEDCATGVAFTRDPATGERRFFGEYLINAQGEDVVAGIRTPQPINVAAKKSDEERSLEEAMPEAYRELEQIYQKLERHYHDMQDIEFTVQQGKLWMLQTRNGKRTVFAALKIAADMVEEKLIDKREAISRIDVDQFNALFAPIFSSKETAQAEKDGHMLTKGLNASPGAAVGQVVFSADEAERLAAKGEKVILVRLETSPDDIKGMAVAQGILTARGGRTSHAAVVARGMGAPCVAGASEIDVSYSKNQFTVRGKTVEAGQVISIDGFTGKVYDCCMDTRPSEIVQVLNGKLSPEESELYRDYKNVMSWVNEYRKLRVRTNADTPHDAEIARKFGAEGIGLCRTEHMFFEGDRIDAMREMILSADLDGRKKALMKILPMQKGDFKGIFKAMDGYPVTIRFLDPPLHEFLPHTDREVDDLSKKMGVSAETLKKKAEELHEFNPMLGHRGCRLGVTFPEIYAMQTRAVMEAACELAKDGVVVIPEMEIPLVGHAHELKLLRDVCDKVAREVIAKTGQKVDYTVGTMIELPRAAITADEIAKHADFFSFGTNDLTQTTFGFSRDDAGKFLGEYVAKKVLPVDPFVTIDRDGVGRLMRMAVELGRKTNPNLDIGICGEHGGDPASVAFCHEVGLNYVSCSPYRVPIALLASARAALEIGGGPGTTA